MSGCGGSRHDRTGLGRHGTRDPSDIDRIVSERILARRNARDMSQPELAERVGVTFQQVQTYENGKNRVSAGRLHEIAKALGVTIQDFCESATRLAISRRSLAEQPSECVGPDTVEAPELLRAFRRIPQPGAPRAVIGPARKQALPPPRSAARAARRKRLAQTSAGQG
jgi:transcriptional regulator with XRE-family HTH domain